MPYYSKVEKWSNIYTYHIGIGLSYGHGFKTVKLSKKNHCGYNVRYGFRSEISGAVYCHWYMGAD